MTNIVERFGRQFEFDDDTPEDVQNKRIENWMRQNAAHELPEPEEKKAPKAEPGKSSADPLKEIARSLGLPGLAMFAAANSPTGRDKINDTNFYRTLAQGALPFANVR